MTDVTANLILAELCC